jgi:hypothetical protein
MADGAVPIGMEKRPKTWVRRLLATFIHKCFSGCVDSVLLGLLGVPDGIVITVFLGSMPLTLYQRGMLPRNTMITMPSGTPRTPSKTLLVNSGEEENHGTQASCQFNPSWRSRPHLVIAWSASPGEDPS